MQPIPYQIGSLHALVREFLRRNAQRSKTAPDLAPLRQAPPAFAIALSREAGTRAGDIAREIGARLAWPVFDRELIERVADDLGLRSSLLEAVDEKQISWIQESVESFRGWFGGKRGRICQAPGDHTAVARSARRVHYRWTR